MYSLRPVNGPGKNNFKKVVISGNILALPRHLQVY